jgi:hypothetical protein
MNEHIIRCDLKLLPVDCQDVRSWYCLSIHHHVMSCTDRPLGGNQRHRRRVIPNAKNRAKNVVLANGSERRIIPDDDVKPVTLVMPNGPRPQSRSWEHAN